MNNNRYKSKTNRKKPLSIIINGDNKLGFELADILLENNGYVIFINEVNEETIKRFNAFSNDNLISVFDYSAIPSLDEELKRLDYVFFFNHDCLIQEVQNSYNRQAKYISKRKNYLDTLLALSAKYKAKFLLTTSVQSDLVSDETDYEFKKYAETLTKEYTSKVNLNGRIVVLGELLGDGMNFDCSNKINKLILNAAKGENLSIPRKGMEKEWFIHVLDAAHGIFKAQFSRISNGNTYLASYEHPYTYISIAYKLQEIEKDAQEIEFYEEELSRNREAFDDLKPLSDIGWAPKVPLEKALKQSISSAKIFLLEREDIEDSKIGVIRRIRAFFELNNGNSKNNLYADKEEGPVARLIMERKRQEEQTKKALEEGTRFLETRSNRQFSLEEKVEDSFSDIFESLQRRFKEVKRKSRIELVKYSFIFLILIFFYFFIFSPLVLLTKDIVVSLISYNNLQDEFYEKNYPALSESSKNISNSLEDMNYILGRHEFLFNLAGKNGELESFKELLNSYKLFSDGISNVTYSLEPIVKYFSTYQSNLELRSKEEGYLKVSKEPEDYENVILDAADRAPYVKLGIDKIDKSLSRLTQINYNIFPQFFADRFLSLNQKMRDLRSELSYLESVEYIPELLGVYGEKNYAFILLDNTDQRPIGGKPVSLAIVTIVNGGIKAIEIKNANDASFKFEEIEKSIIDKINLRRFDRIEIVKSLDDFSYIGDQKDYAESLSRFLQNNFDKSIDGVTTLNFSSLEGFIYKFSEKYSFESSGINFSKDGLLKYLFEEDEELEEKKYEISSSLLAQAIYNILDDLEANINNFFTQSHEEVESQNVSVVVPGQSYNEYIESANLDFNQINFSDVYIKPSLSFITDDVTNSYASFFIKTDLLITNDQIFSFRTSVTLPKNLKAQEFSLCLPLFIKKTNIKIQKVPSKRVKINTGEKEQCILVRTDEEYEAEVSWNINDFKFDSSNLDLNFVVGKPKGLLSTSEFNLTLEPDVKLIDISPSFQKTDQGYSLIQNLSSDKGIKLTIGK